MTSSSSAGAGGTATSGGTTSADGTNSADGTLQPGVAVPVRLQRAAAKLEAGTSALAGMWGLAVTARWVEPRGASAMAVRLLAGSKTGSQMVQPQPMQRLALLVLLATALLSMGRPGGAQATDAELPALSLPPSNEPRPRITEIEVVTQGGRWAQPVRLERVKVGDPLTGEIARRALRELLDTGGYADAKAEAVVDGTRAVLRLTVLPRRLVARVRILGGPLDIAETLAAAQVGAGDSITIGELRGIEERVLQLHARRGYKQATVRAEVADTDDPRRVLLTLLIKGGPRATVSDVRFQIRPWPVESRLSRALRFYSVERGDALDEDTLDAADERLQSELKERGWYQARVTHEVTAQPGSAGLAVQVHAGPRYVVTFSGNQAFDSEQLALALDLNGRDDHSMSSLSRDLVSFHQKRGFRDAHVTGESVLSADERFLNLSFSIREGPAVVVRKRHFPCLVGPFNADDLDAELDGFLAGELPGDSLLLPVDPNAVSDVLGPDLHGHAAARPRREVPASVYDEEAYDRALKHLEDLYQAKGYLDAAVGPVKLLRQHCDRSSMPGACRPTEPLVVPELACAYDEIGMPLEEPNLDSRGACQADLGRGRYCAPQVELMIPIKLGPQTFLYDVAFEGNRALVETELFEVSELQLGQPLSLGELDGARRRILDRYAEDAYAFAEVVTELELSPDRTRARVRLAISEKAQVRISRIVVRGARRTREGLIRSRVALKQGGLYRRSLTRQTEEQLASLGVFSSVTVGFEDPYVPAREKVVVVELVEKNHQYLDQRPGFSTGEGFRITFEYGHRSIAGSAIQFTGLFQLSFLPTALIFEEDVRRKFNELQLIDRLERRNSATLQFPEVGLGPNFRFSVEGVDVRDNSRDFGITKDAAIITLVYRAARQLSMQLGASVELNDASIFGQEQKGALEEYVRNNPQLRNVFRIPEGETLAFSQSLRVDWDRRDRPLEATRGTLVSAGVEHVQATPVGDNKNDDNTASGVFAAAPSNFLRYTNRLAAYAPLSDEGLSLAGSFRWGVIQQLTNTSRTYPDRLFFVGGFDTMRGFLQDSMIPEDIAQRLLDSARDTACQTDDPPPRCLTTREVVVRGGDLFVNPRFELRIPLTATLRTALFLDAGNLWTDADTRFLKSLRLRYAIGSGLRVGTPIGPLVFDYGLNIERLLDQLDPSRKNQRFWEDLGAFHFSIGVF